MEPSQDLTELPLGRLAAFLAGLGAHLPLGQNTKSLTILAAHNEGRVLVAFESSKMSNAKIYVISVQEHDSQTVLGMSVDTDPRSSKAVLDGRFNKKSAIRFGQAVQGALDGTAPAPATPPTWAETLRVRMFPETERAPRKGL